MENSSVIGIIKEIGIIITPIILAWIALQQVKISRKQEVIHKQVNGMQAALIVAEKGVSKAEGKEEQRAEDKVKEPILDVKIVGQQKPVEVTTKKKPNGRKQV